MTLKIKETLMIRPIKDTPRVTLELTRLDMIIRSPNSHTTIFFIYNPPNPSYKFDTETGKKALSQILVPFYPLAGRLKLNANNTRYIIDCAGQGALYVEAETTQSLSDFGDFGPGPELRKLVIPACDYTKDLSSIPLLMGQLTRFKCGGLCFGFALHHHVADGASLGLFLYSLLVLYRGFDCPLQPNHDRIIHLAPRNPPQIKYPHPEFDPPIPSFPPNGSLSGDSEKKQRLFKLTQEQIDKLKQEATSQLKDKCKITRLSTYEILTAHIWRSTCKARNLSPDQEVKLYIPVDGRFVLKNPTLPDEYFGNVLLFSICTLRVSEITTMPFSYVATKVHEAVRRMNDEEYLRSAIDYLETRPELPEPLMGFYKSMYPHLLVNSWAKMPLHLADFGFGLPRAFGNCDIKLEGLSFLISNPSDDGLSLAINLFADHMPLFEKNFYDTTSSCTSILASNGHN
ncbi:hypothetical protein RND81_09G180000 [Saponaria officinalis]|uniref:Uncharacterized protein n=1 Tax=Saponaria officinalis TaxID=3572 RepID=A0AAW1IP02_SAPOF